LYGFHALAHQYGKAVRFLASGTSCNPKPYFAVYCRIQYFGHPFLQQHIEGFLIAEKTGNAYKQFAV
jgi:hypothetical protein